MEVEQNQFVTEGLTEEEDRELVSLLLKWKGGRISTPVFTQLAGMIPQSIVEAVFFRSNQEVLETLLTPRPKGDIVWPGMLHTPGTALRTKDYYRADKDPLRGAFDRIQQEIGGEMALPPTFAGRLHRLGDRGPEVVEVYIAELLEGSNLRVDYVWYPVGQLSNNPKFIQGQLGHVILATERYKINLKSE